MGLGVSVSELRPGETTVLRSTSYTPGNLVPIMADVLSIKFHFGNVIDIKGDER